MRQRLVGKARPGHSRSNTGELNESVIDSGDRTIAIGVLALAYGGISYTNREKIIDLGPSRPRRKLGRPSLSRQSLVVLHSSVALYSSLLGRVANVEGDSNLRPAPAPEPELQERRPMPRRKHR